MQLNELRINSDEELELWKSQWNGTDPIPADVNRYMQEVVLPRHNKLMNDIIESLESGL